jgi:hypothetical protein
MKIAYLALQSIPPDYIEVIDLPTPDGHQPLNFMQPNR